MFEKIKIAGLAAAAAFTMAQSADALTLRVSDSANPLIDFVQIEDGGAGDLDGIVNGSILTGALNVGGGSLSISTAFALDGATTSTLQMTVTNAIAGLTDMWVDVWHSLFSGAAASPQASNATFTMNASDLSTGGELMGRARVGGVFTGAKESITAEGDTIFQSAAVVLDDPFQMRINTDVVAGTTATYDATLVAAVPVPAAGFLLLGALGGLGIAGRRRKKKAA